MARTVKPLEISSYISKQIREAKQPVSFAFFCERRFIKVTAPFVVPVLTGTYSLVQLRFHLKAALETQYAKNHRL